MKLVYVAENWETTVIGTADVENIYEAMEVLADDISRMQEEKSCIYDEDKFILVSEESFDRFEDHLGMNYDHKYLASLSDEELARMIREANELDSNLIRDLVYRATIVNQDLDTIIDNDNYMDYAERAAEVLGVEI